MTKKNELKLKGSICTQQMSAIEWSTDSFLQKLNTMCKDHIAVLKAHTLGDEQVPKKPNRNSGEESVSAYGGVPQIIEVNEISEISVNLQGSMLAYEPEQNNPFAHSPNSRKHK